ncbi:MAG: DEAD/DEAH box helicase [Syntrophomonadaceae bacterium]|nr:DEAD/DEAH box helicase [Syntrophomonadaceae bacterium]
MQTHTMTFREMGLKPQLLQMIEKKGFEKPTPIQTESIPLGLAGRDIMGQAKTGTGKTAAFGIPMLNQIIPHQGLQGMVICPTRELAVQVAEEICSLGQGLRIKALPIYGGQSIDIQLRALRSRPEIIVGTPGRLLDHLHRGTVNLAGLDFVVLDEADEMLDMGFLPDIEKILPLCPEQRQTLLFSATLDPEVQELGKTFMNNPEVIAIASPELTVSLTEQYYYEVNPRQKVETICRVIDVDQPPVSLVFCRTKKGADELNRVLNGRGYMADSLHGDMSQRERDHVMERFRQGNIEILVATDLAARGLDVEMVTHVFNFDIPEDPDGYVHRIGRTGRAGRDGVAITLVEPRQIRQLKIIEKHIGKKINRQILPSLQDAIDRRQEMLINKLIESADQDQGMYREMAKDLLGRYEAEYLLAAALKLIGCEAPQLETANVSDIQPHTAHVELPLGRLQGLHPRRLVEFLTAHTSMTPRQVGDIEIQSNSTLVEIPMMFVDQVYDVFTQYESSLRGTKRPRFSSKRHSASRQAN